MAITHTTRLTIALSTLLSDVLDLSTVRDDVTKSYNIDIGNGTGAGLANQVFHDTRTVSSGATDTLDLAGVLLNGIRQTVTLTALKLLIIKPAAANTTTLTVTRPAANGVPIFSAAGDASPLSANGIFVWSSPGAGATVTAGTGDLIDIVNSAGASATYDVFFVGVQ